ncbi:hypothetical protein [Amycolatopsis anabasis]|uniref:hypothetical protein n=1 Tax=Amycolatopsis anabasis TaxID=1840409 RepID=UPI00131BB8B4|nr:hypothetical protein [Amycolatopsis anabasis]
MTFISEDHPLAKRGKELGGYHVVPRQLAIAGDDLLSTGGLMNRIARDIENTHLGADDLGILGKEADDAPRAYNDSLAEFVKHFQALHDTLAAAGEILNDIAKYYAAKEDEYYEQFNRFDDR